MKVLISSMIILGFISATPVLAEQPTGSGTGQSSGEQIRAYGDSVQQQGKGEKARIEGTVKEGQGEMYQERHRELEKKEVGKETGKGLAQGEGSDPEKGKKWWKFWE